MTLRGAIARICGWFGMGLIRLEDLAAERQRAAEVLARLERQRQAAVRYTAKLARSREAQARLEARLEDAFGETQRLNERLGVQRTEALASLERFTAKLERERERHALTKQALFALTETHDRTLGEHAELKVRLAKEQGAARMQAKRADLAASEKREAVASFKGRLDDMRRQLLVMTRRNEEMGEMLSRISVERTAAAEAGLRKRTGVIRAESPDSSAAMALFALGESFQAKGELALAAETYRKIGDRLSECLAIRTPTGGAFEGPRFLIIGAARAGTTWLKQRLSLHPEILLLAGEGAYFSSWPHLSPRAYMASFTSMGARYLKKRYDRTVVDPRVTPTLLGEKSPAYLDMSDEAIELCAALFPNLRLVCMVREPVARAWSHVKHYGWRRHASDLAYLHAPPNGSSIDEVVAHGRLEGHLRRWARHFRPEQIHLVEYSRLEREPQSLYGEVLEHIGASPFDLPEPLLHERPEASAVAPPPQVLLDHLNQAYENERWDPASLRQAMEEAAAESGTLGGPRPALVSRSGRRSAADRPARQSRRAAAGSH
jgi:hypothetical protein